MNEAEFKALCAKANARYNALSPVDKAIANVRQRASWVRGEMLLGPENAGTGGMSEEAFAKRPKDDASILADEVERLRAIIGARP